MSDQKPIAFVILPRVMLATEKDRQGIPEDIQEAIRSADHEPYLDDPMRPWGGNNVTALVTDLQKAQVVIVDLTGLDPYVIYGLGIAMTLRERVLLLFQGNNQELPVLLSTEYCIFYRNDSAGSRYLRFQLYDAIKRNATLDPNSYCNLVQHALPDTVRQVLRDPARLTYAQHTATVLQNEREALIATLQQVLAAQPKGTDTSSLERGTEQLKEALTNVEDRLKRLERERDVMLAQAIVSGYVQESQRALITSKTDGAAQIFVLAALIVLGPPRLSDEERRRDERFVRAFYMDVTPVTNAQFLRFVEATGYRTIYELKNTQEGCDDLTWRTPGGPGSSIADRLDHPVVWVYRADALAYAAWAGRRLPTRLEWERAMRGVAGHAWPWGDQFDPARCNLGSTDGTTPVDSFPDGVSPAGCLDMIGNAWEWLADELPGGKLVLLGGSWAEPELKAGYKLLVVPSDGTDGATGFRCAMDVSIAESR